MTPEIIEFYVENPGLVTREVKQLLIALSDCYDVAKRYTGIFCQIMLNNDKIEAFGSGDVDKACEKLLKEKKIGRFNEELVVDNGCGKGGAGQKMVPFKRLTADDLTENSQYLQNLEKAIIESLQQKTFKDVHDLLAQQDKLKEKLFNIENLNSLKLKSLIDEVEKRIVENEKTIKRLLDKKIETLPTGDLITNASDIQLFFLIYSKNSCWIDSLIYFLFGPDVEWSYFFNKNYIEKLREMHVYIETNYKMYGVIDNIWNDQFLQSLFTNRTQYKRSGFNDPADVLYTIFEISEDIGNQNQVRPDGNGTQSSQLIIPAKIPSIAEQTPELFFKSTYNYSFYIFPKNILLQSPITGKEKYNENSSKYNLMKKLILSKIEVNQYPDDTEFQRQATYNLVSFLVNLGDGIHYVCYFKRDSKWWKYNDTNVEHQFEEISVEIEKLDIVNDNNNSQQAKIVLYNYSLESVANIA